MKAEGSGVGWRCREPFERSGYGDHQAVEEGGHRAHGSRLLMSAAQRDRIDIDCFAEQLMAICALCRPTAAVTGRGRARQLERFSVLS